LPEICGAHTPVYFSFPLFPPPSRFPLPKRCLSFLPEKAGVFCWTWSTFPTSWSPPSSLWSTAPPALIFFLRQKRFFPGPGMGGQPFPLSFLLSACRPWRAAPFLESVFLAPRFPPSSLGCWRHRVASLTTFPHGSFCAGLFCLRAFHSAPRDHFPSSPDFSAPLVFSKRRILQFFVDHVSVRRRRLSPRVLKSRDFPSTCSLHRLQKLKKTKPGRKWPPPFFRFQR